MATHASLTAALAIMAGAGFLPCGLNEAQAAPITQSNTFSEMALNGNTSVSVAFTGFDTARGTLTEVDVSLASPSVSGLDEFTYTGAEGGGSGFSETASVILPSAAVLTSAVGSATASCYAGGSSCISSDAFALSTPLSTAVTSLTGNSVNPFIGSTVNLTATLGNYTPGDSCPFGTCSQSDRVSFSGTVTVTYDYTPSTPAGVPEPASLALFGLGVVGVAGLRRRRAD